MATFFTFGGIVDSILVQVGEQLRPQRNKFPRKTSCYHTFTNFNYETLQKLEFGRNFKEELVS